MPKPLRMIVSATDAKNRLGQMLEHCQREPVVIEKAGRRHSVLLSAAQYDALLARRRAGRAGATDPGKAFRRRYKDWVAEQHRDVEAHGIWNDDLRGW